MKAYVKLPSVVQNQISSIVFEPDEKDQTKCKLELDDGKVFYVRIEDMEKTTYINKLLLGYSKLS